MQYCNKSLIKNNNEILQYFNKNNDIALVMHQRALLDMSVRNPPLAITKIKAELRALCSIYHYKIE